MLLQKWQKTKEMCYLIIYMCVLEIIDNLGFVNWYNLYKLWDDAFLPKKEKFV